MTRKRCQRRPVVPVPPPGLRAKLAQGQLRDLSLCHVATLDAIAKGEADEISMWGWVGSCMTWARAADLIKTGQEEMGVQLDLAQNVIKRFRMTGRVLFTGPEYQTAKLGVGFMDDLAAIVDRPTAMAASDWAEHLVNVISNRHVV